MTYGFTNTKDNEFVTFRIRQIAAQVGAPVKPPPCFPNVEVYFASKPQQLLDGIREHGGVNFLTSRPSQARQLAAFTRPIQAWYATLTRDGCGSVSVDNEDIGWDGDMSVITHGGCPQPGHGTFAVTGSHVRTGLSSMLGHVYIVIDVNQTAHTSFQAVADYVALLALSRTEDYGSCQPLLSITNLMSSNCDAFKPGAMSATDLAYLTGIYQMDPTASLLNQRNTIISKIQDAMPNN